MGLIAVIFATICLCCFCVFCCKKREKATATQGSSESDPAEISPPSGSPANWGEIEMGTITYDDLPPTYDEVMRSSRGDLVEIRIDREDSLNSGNETNIPDTSTGNRTATTRNDDQSTPTHPTTFPEENVETCQDRDSSHESPGE